jgi:hypothetical protein
MIDQTRVVGDLLFATHSDRCFYLGKSERDQLRWLEENPGRYRRIEDVRREDAPRAPSVEAEIDLGAEPAEPADSSSFPEVRNDGDDKDDVALADAPLGDCSRPCEGDRDHARRHGRRPTTLYRRRQSLCDRKVAMQSYCSHGRRMTARSPGCAGASREN